MLDAGTGLRSLTPMLGGAAFDGSIVLSHLHWDHVQGLPFFAAGDRDDARVDSTCRPRTTGRAVTCLPRRCRRPRSPSRPRACAAVGLSRAGQGAERVEGLDVATVEIEHKGGRTYGIRVDDPVGSVAYLPDHAPAAGGHRR